MKNLDFCQTSPKWAEDWGSHWAAENSNFSLKLKKKQSCRRLNPKLLISSCNWCFGMAAGCDEIKVVQFHKFLDFPIPIPGVPPDTHRLAGYGWAAAGEEQPQYCICTQRYGTENRLRKESRKILH